MRNADYARRAPFELNTYPDVYSSDEEPDNEIENELPCMVPSGSGSYGRASQMEIPILRSDPVPSGVTLPSGFFTSGGVLSSSGGVGSDADVDVESTQEHYN
jgi:hypothetical protein